MTLKGQSHMKSSGRFFLRCALICVALVFGFVEAARANFLDDIGDFFSGNAPEVATSNQCDGYAQAAVIWANAARRNSCPLGGDRYGTNQQGHYFWCMGVTPETSRAEADARFREVVACDDNQIYCKAYGDLAAEAAGNNKLYNCGFTGPRWGEGAAGHRNYCLSERIAQKNRGGDFSDWPTPETSIRSEAIYQCKAKHSKKQVQFCNSYATQAVANAKTFKEKNCDSSQNGWGRWESGYDHHFTWCIGHNSMTATAKAGNSETEIRNAAVAVCNARGGGPPKSAVIGGGKKKTLVIAPVNNSSGASWSKKSVDCNTAMDLLSGGGCGSSGVSTSKPSGGSSSGISTSKPYSPPSGGSSSGISTSKPIPPPSGGSSSGISTSKPISPPSGGSSSGVYLSKPYSPPSGGSSSGVYLSKPYSPPSGGSSSGINLSKPAR